MKKLLNSTALLMLLTIIGCQKEVQPVQEIALSEINVNARAAANTPLTVTILDGTFENGYRISSVEHPMFMVNNR